MIIGKRDYDFTIDIWSVGCVFAELLNDKPIFEGKNNEEMLQDIISKIGTPERALIKELNKDFKYKLPEILPQSWKKVSKHNIFYS